MVGYGKSIVQARRLGWENSYLDYDKLKMILKKIKTELTDQRSASMMLMGSSSDPYQQPRNENVNDLDSLKAEFFTELQLEIEKISLFALKREGQLADAVGFFTFENLNIFDSSPVFSSEMLQLRRNNKLDLYAVVAVELLHLLRFTCINSIGIRKILKKYNKIFETLDLPHYYSLQELVGSDRLQQLATSTSIGAIQASLESVVVRSKEASSSTSSDDEDVLPLYRIRCVLECSHRLRRNAELMNQPFYDFIGSKAMIWTGFDLGAGMNGTGNQVLSWLLLLRPDEMITMNQTDLTQLLIGWTFSATREEDQLPSLFHRPLSIIRETLDDESSALRWGGVNSPTMILNLLSTFLYTVNYYIVVSTANHYSIDLGKDGAYGATLIGASSFSALFAAFFYSYWYTVSSLKSALIFSALCPMIGNMMYGLAISYRSMTLALGGRILCGFGSAEVINRQLISACVSFEEMTKASVLFVVSSAIGMSVGPLLAGILDEITGRGNDINLKLSYMPAGGIIYNHCTAPGFLMAVIWFLQLLSMLVFFSEPLRINGNEMSSNGEDHPSEDGEKAVFTQRSPKDNNGNYGAVPNDDGTESQSFVQQKSPGAWQEVVMTCKLVFENPGLPLTMLIFGYIEMADEVLISSCSMVVRRYFGWQGSVAGFLIASLGALVLPAHFVVERTSRYYSERKILVVRLF